MSVHSHEPSHSQPPLRYTDSPCINRSGRVLLAPSPAAFAANKDMIQLQTQMQQLQDAVARLQQSNDERMGVLKDLIQQNSDSVNKMSSAVDTLQKQLQNQQEGQGGKMDQVSGQVQSLNDSLDEIKARIGRLEKTLQDIQSQQQSIGANMQGQPSSVSSHRIHRLQPQLRRLRHPPEKASPQPPYPRPQVTWRRRPAPAGAAPPVDDLYKTALGDYMAAKYSLASSEFGDVIHFYPDNPLSGNANYYQGEIEYRAGKFAERRQELRQRPRSVPRQQQSSGSPPAQGTGAPGTQTE